MIGFLAASLALAPSANMVRLRYNLHTGQNLQYAVSSTMLMRMPEKGVLKDLAVDTNYLVKETVSLVDRQGVAVIDSELTDQQFVLNGKSYKVKPGVRPVSTVRRVSSGGRVESETVTNGSGAKVSEINPSTMTLQAVFPDGLVRVGSTWTSEVMSESKTGGTFKYTLEALTVENGHRVAVFSSDGTVDLKTVLAGIMRQHPSGMTGTADCKGRYRFDLDRGLFVGTSMNVTLKFQIPTTDPLTKTTIQTPGAGRLQAVTELVDQAS
jgi:hypothetical protein